MRHEGMRVAISTQSPKVLAPELLELVSLLLVHRFHSEDWFTYLKSKVPLPAAGFETIRRLATGQALVFAASHDQARILKRLYIIFYCWGLLLGNSLLRMSTSSCRLQSPPARLSSSLCVSAVRRHKFSKSTRLHSLYTLKTLRR